MPDSQLDLETIMNLVPKLDLLCQDLTEDERQQLALVLRAGSAEIARAAGLDHADSDVEAFTLTVSSVASAFGPLFRTQTGQPGVVSNKPHEFGNPSHVDIVHPDVR